MREQKGLSISSVLDGAGKKLEELIQWSTHPDVLTRIGSVEDFLTLLDDVEDELTAPAEAVVVDPLQAKRGDRLQHGFIVERVLGQGATATALLVTKDEKEYVLKVALSEAENSRLHEEAEALRSIHSEFIVAIEDELVINGKTALVLQKAGDKTLAAQLRYGGRAQPGDARPLRRRPLVGGLLDGAPRGRPSGHQARQHRHPLADQAAEPVDPLRFLPRQCPA